MTESRLYWQFLKTYKVYLLSGWIIGLLLAIIWWWSQPLVTISSWYYLPKYSGEEMSKILVADQIVFDLRRQISSGQLGDSFRGEILIYKPAPMVIEVKYTTNQSVERLTAISQQIQQSQPVVMSGQITKYNQLTNNHWLGFSFILMGGLLGIAISLLKSYWRNY
jgi:hypothetical protein